MLVHTHGGKLTITWDAAQADQPLLMAGPAATVFEGEIELPDSLADSVANSQAA